MGVNLGYEYRNEHVRYLARTRPMKADCIVGTGGAYPRIDNSLSVNEGSWNCACRWPRTSPASNDLVFDTGFRYSDYSTAASAPTPTSSSCSTRPSPTSASAASYNRAIRAPTIIELFIPQLVGQIAVRGRSVRARRDHGRRGRYRLAQCLQAPA